MLELRLCLLFALGLGGVAALHPVDACWEWVAEAAAKSAGKAKAESGARWLLTPCNFSQGNGWGCRIDVETGGCGEFHHCVVEAAAGRPQRMNKSACCNSERGCNAADLGVVVRYKSIQCHKDSASVECSGLVGCAWNASGCATEAEEKVCFQSNCNPRLIRCFTGEDAASVVKCESKLGCKANAGGCAQSTDATKCHKDLCNSIKPTSTTTATSTTTSVQPTAANATTSQAKITVDPSLMECGGSVELCPRKWGCAPFGGGCSPPGIVGCTKKDHCNDVTLRCYDVRGGLKPNASHTCPDFVGCRKNGEGCAQPGDDPKVICTERLCNNDYIKIKCFDGSSKVECVRHFGCADEAGGCATNFSDAICFKDDCNPKTVAAIDSGHRGLPSSVLSLFLLLPLLCLRL